MAVLGIMTHRIQSPSRFAFYAREAARLGFRETLVFTPHDIHFDHNRITAYRYHTKGWSRGLFPYPDVVHDMGFYTEPDSIRKVKAFKSTGASVSFTGYGLGHKWRIHSMLQRSSFAGYIPETELLKSADTVLAMARRHRAVMVKPRNGKQGRGIVKVTYTPGQSRPFGWHREGRPALEPLSEGQLVSMLRRHFRANGAIVQRWMDIRTPKGGVFDIRALVQKAVGDVWRLTAMGVRHGGEGRIASNLAMGGTVRDVPGFIAELYGEAEAGRIAEECRTLALGLSSTLERLYGKRLIELGIDLAVERGGTVRLIEVNIKPGKKIVRALSGEKAYADARLAPIRYAKWLSDRRGCLSKDS